MAHNGAREVLDRSAKHRLRQRQPRAEHRPQGYAPVGVRQGLVADAEAEPLHDPAQDVLSSRMKGVITVYMSRLPAPWRVCLFAR